MPLGIFDAYLNVLRVVGRHIALGDRKAALASPHLYPVIGDAKPDSKTESL
jgi:hypothetical protein